ncbi:UDP-4-amino-4,6-dideoxy-N-acetyl-beta-L-altrosamine transaminase [Thermodesulfobacteriota bacterium]
MIPYGRQYLDEEDIREVSKVLRSNWLTTGPRVSDFEEAVADYVGVKYAVAVNSGTAALHCSMYALGIDDGDEVIVPPMTFAATANCIVYQKGVPVFADVDPNTLLIDPEGIEEKIGLRTKAIVAVDYAGHPCNYEKLKYIAKKNNMSLISDGCHALGAEYKKEKVGTLADMTVFSFHPVKHITTGEGGMIVTNDSEYRDRMRRFRNHGIKSDYVKRDAMGSWVYEIDELGFNYRITDIQCALGISQLKKLEGFLKRRREIAELYNVLLLDIPTIRPLEVKEEVSHAYHLYVIRAEFSSIGADKAHFFSALRGKGIGVNVHYIPVHFHPFYRRHFNTGPGLCPVAEKAYEQIITLPIYPGMSDTDVETVIKALKDTIKEFTK